MTARSVVVPSVPRKLTRADILNMSQDERIRRVSQSLARELDLEYIDAVGGGAQFIGSDEEYFTRMSASSSASSNRSRW